MWLGLGVTGISLTDLISAAGGCAVLYSLLGIFAIIKKNNKTKKIVETINVNEM